MKLDFIYVSLIYHTDKLLILIKFSELKIKRFCWVCEC